MLIQINGARDIWSILLYKSYDSVRIKWIQLSHQIRPVITNVLSRENHRVAHVFLHAKSAVDACAPPLTCTLYIVHASNFLELHLLTFFAAVCSFARLANAYRTLCTCAIFRVSCVVCGVRAQSKVLGVHRVPIGSSSGMINAYCVEAAYVLYGKYTYTGKPFQLQYLNISPATRIRWHVTSLLGFNCSYIFFFVLLEFSIHEIYILFANKADVKVLRTTHKIMCMGMPFGAGLIWTTQI